MRHGGDPATITRRAVPASVPMSVLSALNVMIGSAAHGRMSVDAGAAMTTNAQTAAAARVAPMGAGAAATTAAAEMSGTMGAGAVKRRAARATEALRRLMTTARR